MMQILFPTESNVLCIWNGFTAHLSCEVIVRNDEKFKGFQLSKLQLFENGEGLLCRLDSIVKIFSQNLSRLAMVEHDKFVELRR